MKTAEEILYMLEYLSQDYVEDPKWRLDDMTKLHSSLDENNIMTYISYLAIRKDDITADERDTIEKNIKIKRALEHREITKKYGHFTLIE